MTPERVTASRSTWRLLGDDGQREPRANLALEEALGRVGGDPTLRLWRNAPSVVLGRFQVAAAEVDLSMAASRGVVVVRRFTGGGAVYHDPGNLNVTVVGPLDRPPFDHAPGRRLPGIYGVVLDPLAKVAAGLGLDVERTERDLLLDGRKISGVAAWFGARVALVHGTLLVDADLEALRTVLAGPGAPGDPRWERTKSRRIPVTSLAHELGRGAALENRVLERRVADAFGVVTAVPDEVTPEERSMASELSARRYDLDSWHAAGLDRA